MTEEDKIRAFAKQEEEMKDTPGYRYRELSAMDLAEKVEGAIEDEKVREQLDFTLKKIQWTCNEVAEYVRGIPRAMTMPQQSLAGVFDALADAIENIVESPETAKTQATCARYDAARIPELSAEIRRLGFEEGYRKGSKKNVEDILPAFDIDLD